MRFKLALLVVNTVLFTCAFMLKLPAYWVLVVNALGFVLWRLWITARHPVTALVNQGAARGWVHHTTVRDGKFRDSVLKRGPYMARISFRHQHIVVTEEGRDTVFKDFAEIDEAIAAMRETL